MKWLKLSKGSKSFIAEHIASLMKAPDARQRDRIVLKLLKDHEPSDVKLVKSLEELRKTYHNVQTQNVRLLKKVNAFKASVHQARSAAKTRNRMT